MHIKKVKAEIRLIQTSEQPTQATEARVVLNDLNPLGMGIFSSEPLLVGQEIAITLTDPKRVYLRGRIVWCQEFDIDSHVISQNNFHYRAGIKFTFTSKEEEDAVRQYVDEMARTFLYSNTG